MQILNWQGRAVSVNKWTNVRVIKQGGKYIAMVYKTTVYKNFIKSLAGAIVSANIKTVPLDAYIDITIRICFWKMRDSDSSVKPICDAVEEAILIKNDRQIKDIVIRRSYHKRDDPDTIKVFVDGIFTEKETVLRDLKTIEANKYSQGALL